MSNSIPGNILIYTISSASSFLLFLLFIFAGRYLGAEDFGKFSFAMAFVFLFDPILDPGLYHLLIRDIARKREATRQFISHALTWKFMAAPLAFLITFLAVNILHDSQKTLYAVYLMALSTILKSIKDAFRAILLAHERFGLDAFSLTLERSSLLLAGAYVLVSGQGLIALCWVFVIVRMLILFVIGAIVRNKICRYTLGFDFIFLKNLVITAVPIGAFYITLNLYNYVDTVMLSAFRTDVEVGWYNASYKIYEGLLIIPVIIGTVLMPRLSQLYKQEAEAFAGLFFSGLKYIVILSLFVFANGIFVSDKLILLLYGNSFLQASAALNILLLGILFVFSINFLQTAMITMDKQRVIFYLAALGLIFNVGLNALLIPRYGYIGAASTTVAVEFLIVVSLLFIVGRIVEKVPLWKLFGKPLLSFSVPLCIFWFFSPISVVPLKLALLNLSFFALLFLTRVFDEGELCWLSQFVIYRKIFGLK